MAKRNICLFGTSANPPTGKHGHQGIVSQLVELGVFDEVWVLPVFAHSFANKRDLAPFHHRVAMSRLAFEKFSTLQCTVHVKDTERDVHVCIKEASECQAEALQQLSSTASLVTIPGTAELLDYLVATEPGAVFSMAFGEDTYLDLVNGLWCCREADISRTIDNRFIVIRRSTVASGLLLNGEKFSRLDDAISTQKNKARGSCSAVAFAVAHILELPVTEEVSSTLVRAKLQNLIDESGFEKTLVDPEVVEYAKKYGIYVVGGGPGTNIPSIGERAKYPYSLQPSQPERRPEPMQTETNAYIKSLIVLQLFPVVIVTVYGGLCRFWPGYNRQWAVAAAALLLATFTQLFRRIFPWI
mmetsp:Transcript_23908/g.43724  ORF Transcript_23908/g.43724 Transcript_23908/m.43724 type:complete len:356 (+) Transcript_23908:245-1312(+)